MSPYKEYKSDVDIDIEYEEDNKSIEICECCNNRAKAKGMEFCDVCANDLNTVFSLPLHVKTYFFDNLWRD